jgi:hypothetical protein
VPTLITDDKKNDCQVKCKDAVKSLIVVTENVKQLNKQRKWGKENKRKNPHLATELKILSILHFPVVDRICHGTVCYKMSDSEPTQPQMPNF